jgi:isopentenyldiphosphate isomerase
MIRMDENEEVLDLVNANDKMVGTVSRGEMVRLGYKNPKGFVRFAEAFLVNKDGKIWVPIRGKHKVIAPGGRDFSVAEHVLSGETYEDAIIRAFAEEAGLYIDAASLKLLKVLPPTADKPIFNALFAYYGYDGDDPEYSKEEFDSCEWLAPEELEALVRSGVAAKASLLPELQVLLRNMRS